MSDNDWMEDDLDDYSDFGEDSYEEFDRIHSEPWGADPHLLARL